MKKQSKIKEINLVRGDKTFTCKSAKEAAAGLGITERYVYYAIENNKKILNYEVIPTYRDFDESVLSKETIEEKINK